MRWVSVLLLLSVGCSSPATRQLGGPEGPLVSDTDLVAREVQKIRRELDYLHERVSGQQQQLERLAGGGSAVENSPEIRLDQLAKDVRQLQTHAQELSVALKRIQSENIQPLEQRYEDLARVRQDVEQLVRAVEGPTTPASRSVKVKPGDTLEKIARAHGATVDAIMRLNRLKGDLIHVGQTLHLP